MLNMRLKEYIKAEEAVLTGQAYTIGGRSLTRASLGIIRNAIEYLLSAGATLDDSSTHRESCYVKRIIPVD